MPENLHVVVGLGITGLSCVRYLRAKGITVAVTDSRPNPPNLTELLRDFPDVVISAGKLDEKLLATAHKIILSPGVSLRESAIAQQVQRGTPIVGDIELFAQEVSASVISITGTNAKSTVTTLVGEMAKTAGIKVQVGGNLGKPALDLLQDSAAELFILELSSFQLDTTYSLKSKVATVLNITPDHLDRYDDFAAYCRSKKRIYLNCETAVCNLDDPLTESENLKQKIYFSLNTPQKNVFGLIEKNGQTFLAHESSTLMSVNELPVLGRHYQANALAALAIGSAYGFPMPAMLQTLREFQGLPHRCQLIRKRNEISWYNDSKGTNVGATLAAISGLGKDLQGKLILIAGGVGKNADFTPLIPEVKKYVRSIVLIGEAAPILAEVFAAHVDIKFAETLEEAILIADLAACSGDSVLLSPACASLDMFKNFEERGNVFIKKVTELG